MAEAVVSDTIMELPPRDSHAEALAAKIIDLTLAANADIRGFHAKHDHNGAAAREGMWKDDVLETITAFNKHEAMTRDYLTARLVDCQSRILPAMIIQAAPENE